MPTWWLGLALGLLVAAALALVGGLVRPSSATLAPGSALKGFVVEPPAVAPELALTDTRGRPWRLADRGGKVVALFFGYTRCPDVCPQTLALLSQAKAALGPAAGAIEVAMVTVDLARDRPEVLRSYLDGFDPSFVGLLAADEARLHEVAGRFGVAFARELPPAAATRAAGAAGMMAALGGQAGSMAMSGHDAHLPGGFEVGTNAYAVAHSGAVFLIDPRGRLRAAFVAPFDPADLAHDLRLLQRLPDAGDGG